jgi:hypothetical protein
MVHPMWRRGRLERHRCANQQLTQTQAEFLRELTELSASSETRRLDIDVAGLAAATILKVVQNQFPASRQAGLLEISRQDDDHVVLTHANLLFIIWRGAQSQTACTSLYDLASNLARRCGTGKVSALSIVQSSSRPPSPEARRALARLHDDPRGVIHRSALVFPNDGFVGAIIRSIALSIRQATQLRQKHEVFQRIDRALAWVTEGLHTPNNVIIPTSAVVSEIDRVLVINPVKVA